MYGHDDDCDCEQCDEENHPEEVWPDVDDDFDGDEPDDSYEPIGSCDECDTNLYEDDCYSFQGLQICGQCYWSFTH